MAVQLTTRVLNRTLRVGLAASKEMLMRFFWIGRRNIAGTALDRPGDLNGCKTLHAADRCRIARRDRDLEAAAAR